MITTTIILTKLIMIINNYNNEIIEINCSRQHVKNLLDILLFFIQGFNKQIILLYNFIMY